MPDPTVETTLKMTIWTSVWGIDKYVYSAIGLAGAAILKILPRLMHGITFHSLEQGTNRAQELRSKEEKESRGENIQKNSIFSTTFAKKQREQK